MKVLITGVAGFIGSNVAKALLARFSDAMVIGVDSLDGYYDPQLKNERLRELQENSRFVFFNADIADKDSVDKIFDRYCPEYVLNFAAKVGVRHSVLHPEEYIGTNINGFFNILEACRRHSVSHLVYASSSSVYGANSKIPYSVDDKVDAPVSLYAATKKSNELMAHAYSKLYDIPCTGLRFFTVYGPAGRPDMAYFKFTEKLVKGDKIEIFNYGDCRRDFTYIDDIVEGVLRVMQRPPQRSTGEDGLPVPPYALYNIGNGAPESLLDFVQILQEELVAAGVLPNDYDFQAHKVLVPMQPGDVPVTYADTSALERDFGFRPSTSLRDGLRAFARWYSKYYR
jgi:nucleoside-diphosphate-sugar epimerase